MPEGQDNGGELDEAAPKFDIKASRTFAPWLSSVGGTIAFTTYQVGKLFMIGLHPETGRVSVFERSFPRCMGLGVDNRDGKTTLWMSSLYQLWRMENFLEPGAKTPDGFDAVFVPVEGRTTGDIDIHDIHCRADSRLPTFVATRFNCLATLDREHSFKPVWMPPFIDRLAAEDRCHLNGFTMENGEPAYATCVAKTNVGGAWRDHRQSGGAIIDLRTDEIVADGLSMPHSPRLYGGNLYVLQSGIGEFGRIDRTTGQFQSLCFLPGFVRGVTFVGDHAIIGVSRPRKEETFKGLPVDARLEAEGRSPKSMLAVVNLNTGDIEHTLEITGVIQELYDVAFLPGIKRPKILGFKTPEIRFQIRPAPFSRSDEPR
ncbi:TIGR03032 family protein [Poseidonocella pacifica]|uniref:TIGR03032 family protein n=1 Tax=Poseidonocella pacifica TaxID=871651 RepID=A0A1I0YPT7_9RHOB|nr:TIGR03032 family protein [Poseidonocella pacifica]SFB14328.1 TIGR03032 family protein [Poseidonocella pacifica]